MISIASPTADYCRAVGLNDCGSAAFVSRSVRLSQSVASLWSPFSSLGVVG